MIMMSMVALPLYYFACRVCAWCLWKPEERVGSPETRITGGCEPPRGCRELNISQAHNWLSF